MSLDLENATPAPTIQRMVVKVGTSTLTDPAGRLDRSYLIDLTSQLAQQKAQGREVILVSSGAIRAGREALDARGTDIASARHHPPEDRPALSAESLNSLPYKQAAAAIGQGRLMHTYTEAFAWRNVDCAQVLLTREDIADRRRFLNARNTLLTLLALGVVPIINENDTVAVEEIKFGDNDNLAALVATLIHADLLLILSDVDGLYNCPPTTKEPITAHTGTPSSTVASGVPTLIPLVTRVDDTILALAGGSKSGIGTGGMRTKIEAARIATEAGIRTVIARGRRESVIREVVDGPSPGTTFLPIPESERTPVRRHR